MDEWGRGPWFDPNAPESDDPGETQVIKPRTSGGPRPGDTSAPGGRAPGASVPLGQRLGPGERGDLDALAASQGADPDVSSEGSGMRPRPTLSRPLYPPEPWNTYAGPNSGRFAPLSRPLYDEAQPFAQGGTGSGGTGDPGGLNQRGRGNGRRRGRSVLTLLLLLFMVALLVGGIAFVLINSPFQTGAIATATATAIDTPTVVGTPTPIPPPTAATITLSPATKQLTSAGNMTSCPSGCDIVGNSYAYSENHTSSQFPATQVPQSEVSGTIFVTNNSTTTDWIVSSHDFKGGGYYCTVNQINLGEGESNTYTCTINITAPSSIAAHTIKAANDFQFSYISYDQPAPLLGNGGYYVLQKDCDNAETNAKAPYSQTWANNYIASQSIPSGWAWALSQPRFALSNPQCTVTNVPQPNPFNFTASVTANVNDAAYDPGASQSHAGSRRDNLLPSGYLWKSGSRTGCTPSVSSVASNNKVTLNCSASGTAYVNWTDDMKASLAAAVAGQLKTAALDTCNKHTSGVAANSCSISITGGDGTLLPASASVVTINVKAP